LLGSRETPPPLRFLGRRAYLAAIVVLVAMSPDPDRRALSDAMEAMAQEPADLPVQHKVDCFIRCQSLPIPAKS